MRGMKIGELEQHCGECDVVEYCGNPFCYCLCNDERFSDTEEEIYRKIAENAAGTKILDACMGCTRPDCKAYRYSEKDYADEDCEHDDESTDYKCLQIANYVQSVLQNGGTGNET